MSSSGYFMYLCEKVGLNKVYDDEYGYLNVANVMNSIPFNILIPMDINRAIDAEKEREFYVNETGGRDILSNANGQNPPSILEVLVALCEKITNDAPESSGDATEWFFRIMKNLKIDIPDENWNADTTAYVEDRLLTFNKRQYRGNGLGGAFPLRNPRGDQRKVELWYQMQAYLIENYI